MAAAGGAGDPSPEGGGSDPSLNSTVLVLPEEDATEPDEEAPQVQGSDDTVKPCNVDMNTRATVSTYSSGCTSFHSPMKRYFSNLDRTNSNVERITMLLEKELELEELLRESESGELTKHWMVDSRPFMITVNAVIIANAAQLGGCTRTLGDGVNLGPDWHTACDVLDQAFLIFFSIETVLRFWAYRLAYFRSGWHWLDMAVLIVGYIELAIQSGLDLTGFRTLRVLRVFRLLRLLRLFKDLWVIIEGLLSSLKPTLWICLLLLVELYICSLVCVDTIGSAGNETYPGFSVQEQNILRGDALASFNNYQYFGTIPRSMYTLFNVVIGAEWPEIGRAVWERQPPMFVFFAFFIICTMFGLMNVLIGVIVDNTKSAQTRLDREEMHRNKARKAKCLAQLCHFVFGLDLDKDGSVTIQDIVRVFEKKDMQPLLSMMDLPHGFTAEELFHLFNFDGGDYIEDSEFVTQAYRLIYGTQSQHQFQMMAGINQIRCDLAGIARRQEDMERRQQIMEADIAGIRQEARSTLRRVREMGNSMGAEQLETRACSPPGHVPAGFGPRPPEEGSALRSHCMLSLRKQLETMVASSQALIAQMDRANSPQRPNALDWSTEQRSGIAREPKWSAEQRSGAAREPKWHNAGREPKWPPHSRGPRILDEPRAESNMANGAPADAAAPTSGRSLLRAAAASRPGESPAILPDQPPPLLPNMCDPDGESRAERHRPRRVR